MFVNQNFVQSLIPFTPSPRSYQQVNLPLIAGAVIKFVCCYTIFNIHLLGVNFHNQVVTRLRDNRLAKSGETR